MGLLLLIPQLAMGALRGLWSLLQLLYSVFFGSARGLGWGVLALTFWICLHLAAQDRDRAREQLSAHLVADAKAAYEQASAARRDTNQMRTQVQTAAVATEQKVEDRHERVEAVLDGVRAGAVRVRERLTCPVAGAAGVLGAAGSAAAADDGAPRGLSADDVQFLVRFAQRAGDVQDERNLGQAYANTVSKRGRAASGPASAAEAGSP
jgi:hypothetical protein